MAVSAVRAATAPARVRPSAATVAPPGAPQVSRSRNPHAPDQVAEAATQGSGMDGQDEAGQLSAAN